MRILYHTWLNPFCRAVRVSLAEKNLAFTLELERVWERRGGFLAMNPAGEVPVLSDGEGRTLCGPWAIHEYLEECYPEVPLLGQAPLARAEVRRLTAWFDVKFNREVTANLAGEKVEKRLAGLGGPDSRHLRAGYANISTHLSYISWLADRRSWLAGERFSLADIAAAAHLSAVDYVGDVPWEDHPAAKDWYARIKSRPSFRALLDDRVPSAIPPPHYADLDF